VSVELLYAILFMAVVFVIVIAGASYMWVTRDKPAPKKRPKKRARPPALTLTPRQGSQETGGTYVPPEVPRTVGTIKQIAQSEPELIEGVLRGWIKGGIAPAAESLKKKKRHDS